MTSAVRSDPTEPERSLLPAGFEATGPSLGVGSTAVVWPVRRVLDGRRLALKVWRRPFADARERERFRREIRRQAALNEVSGHIVTYSWAEEDPPDGTPWIGTLLHGSSLQQLLERGGIPLRQRVVLCADLLAGLAAMHRLGLVHRDVKPGNVLADGGRAKLCDLGLVLDHAAHTEDGAAGTPRYLAPELLTGARPSARTDVYSAARTLREILGPGLPGPLEQLVTEAASVDPADRPADAAVFTDRFRRACEDLGHRLPPPLPGDSDAPADDPVGTRPPTHRRGPGVRALAAAVAVLALGVAGVLVLLPGQDAPAGTGVGFAAGSRRAPRRARPRAPPRGPCHRPAGPRPGRRAGPRPRRRCGRRRRWIAPTPARQRRTCCRTGGRSSCRRSRARPSTSPGSARSRRPGPAPSA